MYDKYKDQAAPGASRGCHHSGLAQGPHGQVCHLSRLLQDQSRELGFNLIQFNVYWTKSNITLLKELIMKGILLLMVTRGLPRELRRSS